MRKALLIKDVPEIKITTDKEFVVKARVIEEALVVDIYYKTGVILKKLYIQKNKYETYDYENSAWNQKKLDNNRNTQCSQYFICERQCDIDQEAKQIIMSHGKVSYHNESWWSAIERYQSLINYSKYEKNNAKRISAIKERMDAVGDDIPSSIQEWLEEKLPRYLFYKKKGKSVTCKCSECGDTYTTAFKRSETYLGQFETITDEPKKDMPTRCMQCGAKVTWTQFGHCTPRWDKVHGYTFQKYKEVGVVLRYFEMEKESYVDEGIYTKKAVKEIARIFFHPDEKIQKDYHKYDPYNARFFWDDCNLYGFGNIRFYTGKLMMSTLNNLDGTILQYSGIREYISQTTGGRNISEYLTKYMKYPVVERLVKAGLVNLADRIDDCVQNFDITKKRLVDILRIKKERLSILRRYDSKLIVYRLLVFEKEKNLYIEDDDLNSLLEWEINKNQLKNILRCMTVKKFVNHTKRYIENEVSNLYERVGYGHGCYVSKTKIPNMYADTLGMLIDLEYDLENTVHIYPANLKAKHDELALIFNDLQNEKTKNYKNAMYIKISTMFEKLLEELYFEKNGLFIRPATSAAEIVTEGQTLHHCVGGENYLRRHDEGSSYILFIRKANEPDIPYVTVEYCDGKIKQWYGLKDSKVDAKQNEKFLGEWITFLNNKAVADQMAG